MFRKLALCCGIMMILAGTVFSSNIPDFDPTDRDGNVIWQRVPIPESRGGLSEPEWAIAQMAIKPTQYYYHRPNETFWKKILAEKISLSSDSLGS